MLRRGVAVVKAWPSGNRDNTLVYIDPTDVASIQNEDAEKTKLNYKGGGYAIVIGKIDEVYAWWVAGRGLHGALDRWVFRLSQRKNPLTADEKRQFWADISAAAPSES